MARDPEQAAKELELRIKQADPETGEPPIEVCVI
jgi:hypothetical protein